MYEARYRAIEHPDHTFLPAYSQYPRYHKGRTKQKERDTTRRGKDALTQAQEDLENAALVVTKKDAQIVKELGHDTSFETYVKLVLSRLRPFLVYFAHHGPQQVRINCTRLFQQFTA